jgi:hypothetical protein
MDTEAEQTEQARRDFLKVLFKESAEAQSVKVDVLADSYLAWLERDGVTTTITSPDTLAKVATLLR